MLAVVPIRPVRPGPFLVRRVVFEAEDLFFGLAGAPAFLPAYTFAFLLFPAFLPQKDVLDLVGEYSPGDEAVEGLGALSLTLDLYAGRDMLEVDAGRHLVDILPPVAA